MTAAKKKLAKKRAGELVVQKCVLGVLRVEEGRRTMHEAFAKFGPKIWLADYHFTKDAIVDLRAYRYLFDGGKL